MQKYVKWHCQQQQEADRVYRKIMVFLAWL